VLVSSFWPPRHTADRVAAEVYRRRHVDEPWLTRQGVALLSELLRGTDRLLEWGSGRSTTWLAHRAGSVRSIEHDPAWYDRVRRELERARLDRETVRMLSTEPAQQPASSPYVRAIDEFAPGELDVCVVDGEHRALCVLEVLPKLATAGWLVLDDAHHYLDHPTASPHSRHGRGPADADWARVQAQLDSWRQIWTSDGYSDTAFWIKP
jgi:predicted O-methyltransferase YrrM